MTEKETLKQLIKGCQQGKTECFSQLVDTYGSRLYGYFYRLSGNTDISDDLLSELFVRIVEKINTFKGGNFESWLFKIASNIFYDYLRDKQRQKKLIETRKEYIESQTTPPKTKNDEKPDKLQKQLQKLDADTRELIMMRFYSQLSFKEIAAIRSEPIGTTLSKVHRGVKKLRELMEQ